MNEKNQLKEQVLSIPAMMEDVFWTIEADARLVVPTPEIYNTRQLWLVGSGDSYNAGTAAEMAFGRLGGVYARALPPLQASRYLAGVCLPKPEKDVLAIGISGSGTGARIIEAIRALAKAGVNTLALTAKPDSPLGTAAAKVLRVETPPFAPGPGVRGMVTSLLALYLLAVRFGEVRARYPMDTAAATRKQLAAMKDPLAEALGSLEAPLGAFAAEIGRCGRLEILASGPARASADFCAAKLLETQGLYTAVVDVEEFNHLNYFRAEPEQLPTLLVCPEDARDAVRCAEIAGALKALGRPYRILAGPTGFEDHGDKVLRCPGGVPEMFSPLLHAPLLALLAALVPMPEGQEYYHGHKGPWDESLFKSIKTSEIVLDGE